ncbi:NUDIX domain-containing protein, partial [Proteiniclasticum sp.]|uniref:NUDIX domain-containing protein n=1 Tax=Proteiniclasticum sp. TaxID=2053595 RepID=UPI0028972F65
MRTNYYALVEEYLPQTNEDKAIKDSILNYIQRNREAVLTREDPMAHMTASTVILNETATKMLMIHHRIYDAWTWQGGHADGEEDLVRVAIKEAKEETGLSHFSPVISR